MFFLGVALLLGGLSPSEMSYLSDPIFNVHWNNLMFFFGGGYMVAGFICLFFDRKSLGLFLTTWFSTNLIAYRIGLWIMGWRHSDGFMIGSLGFSLISTDIILTASSLFLFMGSIAILWTDYQGREAAENLKMFCSSCGGHIKFAIQNVGQIIPCPHCQKTITLQKPDKSLKMSCFFCKEHIEFPIHALGQKTKCPHCSMDITLKETANI